MFEKLLVAVDGSMHADKAVDVAVDLAKLRDGELILLSVYKHMSYVESSVAMIRMPGTPQNTEDVLKGLAREAVTRARTRAEAGGVSRVRTIVRRGQPARTITRIAQEEDADAIVLGSRGLGDTESFLLGSVSHKVLSLSKCTCITVK
jgi:nucleotide-binding universal stress UspA family protein